MSEQLRYHNLVFDSARWEGFELREDDIIISTPAKCGTTWMQMLCALLVFDTAELPRPLTELSPWLDATTYDTEAILAWADAYHARHGRWPKG